MKLSTDIIIKSLKTSLLEIAVYPIDSFKKYRKQYCKDSKKEVLSMSTDELYELVELIFIQQSISVNNQTALSTRRIRLTQIGTLVYNPIYKDILNYFNEHGTISNEEAREIIDEHIAKIRLLRQKNKEIDINDITDYGKYTQQIDT